MYHYKEPQNQTRHYEERQRRDVVISIHRLAIAAG